MYKVMIVDDEVWVRRGLKEQIDWNGLQAELCGEASDGEEAYELALKLQPDIIVTDIKMPHMDGIQLIELVNRDIPNAKVIVISGYSEFELVQKAMVNKAINYILKPIKEKDLNQTILLAIKEIEKAREERKEKQNLKIILNQSLPVLKQKYMNLLISDKGVSSSEFRRMKAELGIDFDCDRFQIAVLSILNYTELNELSFKNNIDLFDFSINNIIYESYKGSIDFITFKNVANNFEHVILIGYKSSRVPQEISNETLSFTQDVLGNLKKYLKAEVCIGVGKVCNCTENIPGSYSEASYASKSLRAQNYPGIMFFENMKKKDSKDDTLERVIIFIKEHYNGHITLETVAEKFFLNPSYLSRVFKTEFGENFIDYVTKIRIDAAIKLFQNSNLKTYDIAEMVGYENCNYFSKLFKKQIGCTPTEYREKILK